MDANVPLWNWAPVLRLALLGLLVALLPLSWWWLRSRQADPRQRLRALTLLTLFLTFDLVLFGAFTRLTDSGLGCPDWPGCYGSASPIGADAHIDAAEAAMPTGPVTTGKAWIEMIHRYLATGVGVLILVMTVAAWTQARRSAVSPWWATLTLAWVCMQGAFGALTVTLKLYPAIVTAHLLGGIGLLVLLALQAEWYRDGSHSPSVLPPALYRALQALFVLAAMQIALGGWVSTNYAVLVCTDFPTCRGSWWPEMDFASAFGIRRELGHTATGELISLEALTAIHYTHRLAAYAVLAALVGVGWALLRAAREVPTLRVWGRGLVAVAIWQALTGLSNVVLGWPLLAAVSHTGGAAALMVLLATVLARAAAAGPARAALASGAAPVGGFVKSAP